MPQILLNRPARLSLIAYVVTPALTVAINAATPRVSIKSTNDNRAADTAGLQTCQVIYQQGH